MEFVKPECAKCGIKNKICRSPEGQGPTSCPTLYRKEVIEKATEEYAKSDILKFAHEASVQEAECYIKRDVKPSAFSSLRDDSVAGRKGAGAQKKKTLMNG
jgi:hypothetical protein